MDVTPSAEPIPPAPPAAPTTPGRALRTSQIVGFALLGAGLMTGIAVIMWPQAGFVWCLVAPACAAVGAWLAVYPLGNTAVVGVALGALALGGFGFGMSWPWLSWWGLGAGIGVAVRWGYQRKKRGLWFTGATVSACFAAAAVAALVQAAQGRGLFWVFCQGLGSLVAAYALQKYAARSSHEHTLRLASRALGITGIVLPYAALLLAVLHRAV